MQSYAKIGFQDFFDEAKIIFQEVSDHDKLLAEKYGFDYVGMPDNQGIQGGNKLISEHLTTDYVLILENDNPVVESEETTYKRILKALEYLENGTLDLMRLRHRWHFGEGFSIFKYSRYYPVQHLHEKFCHSEQIVNDPPPIKFLRRLFRPLKALRMTGRAVYYEKEPHKLFPKYIHQLEDGLFSVDSRSLFWTNQCVLLSRDLYKQLLDYADAHPAGRTINNFQYLEPNLDCWWWKKQHFKIGIGDGVFTHNRFDDSWRAEHRAFNVEVASTH